MTMNSTTQITVVVITQALRFSLFTVDPIALSDVTGESLVDEVLVDIFTVEEVVVDVLTVEEL